MYDAYGLFIDGTWRAENFTPIAATSPFKSDDEAVAGANATERNLAACALTHSLGGGCRGSPTLSKRS